jgi:hypothetical protein
MMAPTGCSDIKHSAREGADEYVGTAQALVAAGLVRLDQLPGTAGLPKTIVRIRPDGAHVTGALHANKREARLPGAKWVERRGHRFSVTVLLSDEARVQRRRASMRLVWSS